MIVQLMLGVFDVTHKGEGFVDHDEDVATWGAQMRCKNIGDM